MRALDSEVDVTIAAICGGNRTHVLLNCVRKRAIPWQRVTRRQGIEIRWIAVLTCMCTNLFLNVLDKCTVIVVLEMFIRGIDKLNQLGCRETANW